MEYIKEYWGITEYYKNGVLHRDGDLPAVISARGDLEYWKNGKRHRDNGPAVIRKNGVCSWYKNGVHLVTCLSEDGSHSGRVKEKRRSC